VLYCSKAFVTYSVSGLENPLTHLFLAVFVLVYLRTVRSNRHGFLLAFIVSLSMLNRLDTLLLFLPALSILAWRVRRSPRGAGWLLAGFVPIVLWEAFSIIYYGFPFPNTAYAKLATGIPLGERTAQGVIYLIDSVQRDPVSLASIGTAIVLVFSARRWELLPFAGGVLLHLAYVVSMGGDFMSGRFLSAPLLLAAILLARGVPRLPRHWGIVPAALVLLFGLFSLLPRGFPTGAQNIKTGITDERAYYSSSSLLGAQRNTPMPTHGYALKGRELASQAPLVHVTGTVGLMGFFGGPDVHIVDQAGLADPLLARLPPVSRQAWRPGHFWRTLPDGYLETVRGENALTDPDLARYYDHLRLITRGALFDSNRWRAIRDMNLGRLDHLVDRSWYRFPDREIVSLASFASRKDTTAPGDSVRTVRVKEGGMVVVDLDGISNASRVEVITERDDDYLLILLRDRREVARLTLERRAGLKGTESHRIDLPEAVAASGYDEVRVAPVRGNGQYGIGDVTLSE